MKNQENYSLAKHGKATNKGYEYDMISICVHASSVFVDIFMFLDFG